MFYTIPSESNERMGEEGRSLLLKIFRCHFLFLISLLLLIWFLAESRNSLLNFSVTRQIILLVLQRILRHSAIILQHIVRKNKSGIAIVNRTDRAQKSIATTHVIQSK